MLNKRMLYSDFLTSSSKAGAIFVCCTKKLHENPADLDVRCFQLSIYLQFIYIFFNRLNRFSMALRVKLCFL